MKFETKSKGHNTKEKHTEWQSQSRLAGLLPLQLQNGESVGPSDAPSLIFYE